MISKVNAAHLDGNKKLTAGQVANHSRYFLEGQHNLHKLIVNPDASVFANVMGKHIVALSNKKYRAKENMDRAFD